MMVFEAGTTSGAALFCIIIFSIAHIYFKISNWIEQRKFFWPAWIRNRDRP